MITAGHPTELTWLRSIFLSGDERKINVYNVCQFYINRQCLIAHYLFSSVHCGMRCSPLYYKQLRCTERVQIWKLCVTKRQGSIEGTFSVLQREGKRTRAAGPVSTLKNPAFLGCILSSVWRLFKVLYSPCEPVTVQSRAHLLSPPRHTKIETEVNWAQMHLAVPVGSA